ncbi:MAG: nucleotide-binding protein [Ignavibacteria bacterium]|nr:nucleotide-binding protein [Ignavibacteria bacterium]
MKNKLIISALFLMFICVSSYSQDTVSSKDAKSFIGETKIVKGLVAGVFVSNKGTVLINFDEDHPNSTFVGVIKVASSIDYANIKKGVTLAISGKIEDYKGKPEIIITDQSQIIKIE